MTNSVYLGYPPLGSSNAIQTSLPSSNTGFPGYPHQQIATAPTPTGLYPQQQITTVPASAPLLAAYNSNQQLNLNPSFFNPINFRHPNNKMFQYLISLPSQEVIDPSTLANLKTYLSHCLNGFNPCELNFNHPIHAELKQICMPILEQIKSWPLEKKTNHLNQGIPQIVSGCSEMDLQLSAKLPKFELLELGLRFHFYLGLIEQEKAAIESTYRNNKKLPEDLSQREATLHQFATSNDFYLNPYSNMYVNLVQQLVENDLSNAITKTTFQLPLDKALSASERFISSQLKNLQLVKASQCASGAEGYLRSEMTRKLITSLASQYRNTFEKTGLLNKEQLKKDIDKLYQFLNKNQQSFNQWNLHSLLTIEIFALDIKSQAPFCAVRAKATQEEGEQLTALDTPKKSQAFFSWPFTSVKTKEQQEKEIKALAEQKQKTIDAVEEEWNTGINSPPSPSAPPLLDVVQAIQTPAPVPQPTQQMAPTPSPLQPGQQTVQLAAPAPAAAPVAIALPSSTDNQEVPLISYIDIAFEDLLKKEDDQQKWNSLPLVVQKDVMRHLNYQVRLKGRAEDVARRLFTREKIFTQMDEWNKKKCNIPDNGLDKKFVTDGQALLDSYYSDKDHGQYYEFTQRFRALPKNALFYQYVYEMAVKANVRIESWDHEFAKYNWDKPSILPLSIQALERCLHAKKT